MIIFINGVLDYLELELELELIALYLLQAIQP